ncbi:translational GTPase TypA [Candidatus Falkowbacteria bacterium]|nr:MAG: translational GTPase TypA [Candidatus Falkowbacteria bacterium]
MKNLRNIAIIAHVDHGKTTLVDALLKQSETRLNKETADSTLIMDSNELERERGITIFSKNASVVYKGTKINIIDTPGHADFGGEVERVLKMADGCLLLIDAKEGPMPQTRFVLKKALALGLRVIVVVNKIDKPGARTDFALNKTFDLFVELGATDEIIDFPIIYASAKNGLAGESDNLSDMKDITPVFEMILKHIPEPVGDASKPLQMLVTTISGDSFKGRLATGILFNGKIKMGQQITRIKHDGTTTNHRLVSLMTYQGLERVDTEDAHVGDIIAISGIADINIGETIADPNNPEALPILTIEEPTVQMVFTVNDSPFAGKEGKFSTSRQIRERLMNELENDMALRVEDHSSGGWVVSGRGELHLAILIERLRREGFEFQVSRPQVITKNIEGRTHVPFEQVFIEVPEEYSGTVIQKLGSRHAEMKDMRKEGITVFLEFIMPTRGLFGYRSEFLSDTRGLGLINASFLDYRQDSAQWPERDRGSLVAFETGTSNLYGLLNVQGRGTLFFGPGIPVYKGQVIGQNARSEDIEVNICKAKQLSNMRSKGEGVSEHFKAPKTMDLEESLEYIGDDELVEVTPLNIRIRKMTLDKALARKKELGIK